MHRDIKSLNVLVNRQSGLLEVKLCDFGMAVVRDAQRLVTGSAHDFTLQWAAPELLRGEDHKPASDVYSFGVLAYELFVLRIPFDFANTVSLYHQVGYNCLRLQVPPNDPPQVLSTDWAAHPAVLGLCEIPAAISAIIRECFLDEHNRPTFHDITERLLKLEAY
jgi:serine/threonine protein kinase